MATERNTKLALTLRSVHHTTLRQKFTVTLTNKQDNAWLPHEKAIQGWQKIAPNNNAQDVPTVLRNEASQNRQQRGVSTQTPPEHKRRVGARSLFLSHLGVYLRERRCRRQTRLFQSLREASTGGPAVQPPEGLQQPGHQGGVRLSVEGAHVQHGGRAEHPAVGH